MFRLGIIASAFRAAIAFLLDTYPSASAAYSLRKLRTAYSGSAIRVRRSYDNAESDIGFDGSGNLNTAALQSFVGYQNLNLYSGNFTVGTHWVSTGNASTVLNVVGINGNTTMTTFTENTSNVAHGVYANTANKFSNSTGKFTVSAYFKQGTRRYVLLGYDNGTPNGVGVVIDTLNWTIANMTTTSTITASGIENAGGGLYRVFVTGTISGTNTLACTIYGLSSSASGSTVFVGNGSTIIAGDIQFTVGDMQPYQPTTTVANTANGFVTTWYDQSGNSLNLTQPTAGSQPRIVNGGIIEFLNGKPYVYFNGSTFLNGGNILSAGTNSLFATGVAKLANNTSFYSKAISNDVDGRYGLIVSSGSTIAVLDGSIGSGDQSAVYPTFTTEQSLYTQDFVVNSLHKMYINKVNTATYGGALSTIKASTYRFLLGAYGNATDNGQVLYLTGGISELNVYLSNQSANRTGIQQNINGYYQIYWDGSQPRLLNTYSGAAAAYSLRNLSSTYTGALIRVRRSSDNAELDIYGNYQGNLDTATLLSFVGSGNGLVTTWYDQSGNGRNGTQATAANQPMIVNAGVLVTANNKVSILFKSFGDSFIVAHNAVFNYSPSNYLSSFSVVKGTKTSSTIKYIFSKNNSGAVSLYASQTSGFGSATTNAFFAGTSIDILDGITKLVSGFSDTNVRVSVNGQLTTGAAISGTVTDTSALILGGDGASNRPWGHSNNISEIIIYNSSQLGNKTNIESNINSYYNIY